MLPNDYPRENYMALLGSILYSLSPERAMLALGLIEKPYSGPRRTWSNMQLLEELKRKAIELKKTPTIDEINADPDLASGALYVKRFGTYKSACDLVGIKPNLKGHRSR